MSASKSPGYCRAFLMVSRLLPGSDAGTLVLAVLFVQAAFTLSFVGIRMKESVGTLIRSLATCNVALR